MPYRVLFLLSFIATCYSQCISNCSSHGTCVNNLCYCNADYFGDDCSYHIRTLYSGIKVSGLIEEWSWDFYLYENSQEGGISFEITPKDTNFSDCDLFIRKDNLPNSMEWDYADIEWGTTAKVIVTSGTVGRWYIGILANFISCPYNLVVTFNGACSSGCLHGLCQTDGICECQSGWTGVDCSIAISNSAIQFDQYLSGSVEIGAWNYYFIDLQNTPSSIVVEFNITSVPYTSHDCDLFVNYEEIPSLVNWLYQESSISSYFTLEIPAPVPGRWYLGVWGYQESNYIFRVLQMAQSCVAQCSQRGTCVPPCSCNVGYAGDYCQNKTAPLQLHEVVHGYLDQNTWNYFTFFADSSQDNIVISVNQSYVDGDVDLYVKVGETPTRWNYDFVDISINPNFDLVIFGVVQNTLYIGAFGWTKSAYDLVVHKTQGCIPPCVHGTCSLGVCYCTSGWSGVSCNSTHRTIYNAVSVSGSLVTANSWDFYDFTSTGNTIEITLLEVGVTAGQSGLLFLLVAESREPNLRVYSYQNTDLRKPLHSISINLDDRLPGVYNWTIGVYATAGVINPVEYKMAVWDA